MFLKFNGKLYNISSIMMIEKVKSEDDLPKYGISATGGMGSILGTEWFNSVDKQQRRFLQIQTALGAEDCYIGGNCD